MMVNNCPIGMNKKPEDDVLFKPTDNASITDSSDDEQTLEEEECLAAEEKINQQDEINNLEKEKDMPLEDLLALYNYETQNINNNKQNEIENNFETTVENLNLQDYNETSHLQELLQPIPESNCLLEENVENDPDFVLENEKSEWKNTIMVGKEYQAQIPEICCYDGITKPYENEDLLLWKPKATADDDTEIEAFLRKANTVKTNAIPQNETQLRDDAQFLFDLLQSDYNVNEALKKKQKNYSNYVSNNVIKPFSDMECLGFEQGMTRHGKDFWKIQQNYVKTRTVKELVHFYYLWKKTERHDSFAVKTRTQKKRYLINPGLTDYMDRFFRDPNCSAKNKENCVQSIPGIINSEQTDLIPNEESYKSDTKITRSKSKSNHI